MLRILEGWGSWVRNGIPCETLEVVGVVEGVVLGPGSAKETNRSGKEKDEDGQTTRRKHLTALRCQH